jgi:YHS domain-containing protein
MNLISINAQDTKGKYFVNDKNVVLNGYDVVNYFTTYTAQRGSKNFSMVYKNVTYYFENAGNLKVFKENPEKYLPQYGGYCAYAMGAQNAKVPSDPNTFKIYNGKLYLFFNDYYNGSPFNTIIPWNSDEVNMKKKADSNWLTMNK